MKSAVFQKVEVSHGSARCAELIIICPGCLPVFLHLCVELKGAHLCHRVIHIVERIQEDMLLFDPECSTLEELISCIISPGHVDLLQTAPDCSPLHCGHFRIFKYLMLIFVYAEHIRDLHKSVCQMLSAVFLCLISKEILHPRISPELHAHGMDLIDLTGGMT